MYYFNTHLGTVTQTVLDDDAYSALEQSLEEGTKPYETLFSRTYAGEALKEDNETFGVALMDFLDLNGQADIIVKFGIPTELGDWTILKLMAGAALAATANNMNISLRQEFTRAFLDSALVDSGVTTAKTTLGSWISEAFKGVVDLAGKVIKNVASFFQNLGKTVGTGLRKFGEHINRIYQIVYNNIGFGVYLLDLVGLGPGFQFIFGSLLKEIGAGLETGKGINWKSVAAAGATYLNEMAFRLQVASNFLPPPWNLIAKLVAAAFKVGAYLINDALMKHVMALMEEEARRNAMAREAWERMLYEEVYAAFDLPMPPMLPSLHGSTGSNNSGEPVNVPVLLFAGIAGIVGLKLLGLL